MIRRRLARRYESRAQRLTREQHWDDAADMWSVAADAWEELGENTRARFARRQAFGVRRHKAEWQPVRVMFRKDRGKEGWIFAILPDLRVQQGVTIFSQHGHTWGALYANIDQSRPAKPEEYEALERMMVVSYGYDVRPILRLQRSQRPPHRMPKRVGREWKYA